MTRVSFTPAPSLVAMPRALRAMARRRREISLEVWVMSFTWPEKMRTTGPGCTAGGRR